MTDPKVLLVCVVLGVSYWAVNAVKKPVNAAAKKTAHGIVHVVTLGKK